MGVERPVRLVVADDEAVFLLLFRVQVSALAGVELVGEAKDGAEAVELAFARHADAVLLDCLMPGMDGFEAAAAILDALPGVRVYLHSAAQTAANADAAEALGLTLLDKLHLDETLLAVAARSGSELPFWEPPLLDGSSPASPYRAVEEPGPDSRRLGRVADADGAGGRPEGPRAGRVDVPRSARDQ